MLSGHCHRPREQRVEWRVRSVGAVTVAVTWVGFGRASRNRSLMISIQQVVSPALQCRARYDRSEGSQLWTRAKNNWGAKVTLRETVRGFLEPILGYGGAPVRRREPVPAQPDRRDFYCDQECVSVGTGRKLNG
ncbi:hypothetical protein J6590_039757 [Homalodisca vitripennis]|nr:hypothetical protein J6590_039757 [Homalodisca vitripennis]